MIGLASALVMVAGCAEPEEEAEEDLREGEEPADRDEDPFADNVEPEDDEANEVVAETDVPTPGPMSEPLDQG